MRRPLVHQLDWPYFCACEDTVQMVESEALICSSASFDKLRSKRFEPT